MTRNFTDAALRRLIGFNNLNNLYTGNQNFPPYNIVEQDENHYVIEMAVAGYERNEIEVTVTDSDRLNVRGTPTDNEIETLTYIHQGIANRAFESQFALSNNMDIKRVKLENGILSILIVRDHSEGVETFEVE